MLEVGEGSCPFVAASRGEYGSIAEDKEVEAFVINSDGETDPEDVR
jgi:hypothetical protein